MFYFTVGNRCAFDPFVIGIDSEFLPLLKEPRLLARILEIFFKDEYGIRLVEVDLIAVARDQIGKPTYQNRAKFSEAPSVVDCSSFVKWVYAQRGIWLPRLSIQQRHFTVTSGWGGDYPWLVSANDLLPCDLIFTEGPWYIDNPQDNVGHVGIMTDNKTVIHATSRAGTVIESPLEEFFGDQFRGTFRVIPKGRELLTLEMPPEMEIETSDDLLWLIVRDFRSWLKPHGRRQIP